MAASPGGSATPTPHRGVRLACGVGVRTWLASRCEGILQTDYERGVVVVDEVKMNEQEG